MATQATAVSDGMFLAAARALAATVSPHDLSQGALFPALETIRTTSVAIASAVVRVALEEGLATVEVPDDIESWVADRMYQPIYPAIPSERRKPVLVGS